MDLSEYTGKPCRTKTAYEFTPKKPIKLDLNKVAQQTNQVTTIEVNTKLLLMLKKDQCMITIFPSGRILIRGERNEEKARRIVEKIVSTIKESVK